MPNTSGDKQIKVTAVADQRSFEIAISQIRRLKSEVQSLAQEMSKVGGQGLFGGMTSLRGGVNPQQQATRASVGVPAGGIGQAVAAEAAAMTKLSKSGVDALRQAMTGTRTIFGEQKREIDSMIQSWTRLAQAQGAVGGGGWRGFMGEGLGQGGGVGWQAMGGPPPMPMSAATRANLANPWLAGGIQGPPPPAVGLQQANARGGPFSYGGRGSFSFGGIIGGVMAGGAIAGGWNAVTQAVVQNDTARNIEAARQLDTMKTRMQVNQVYGGLGMDIRRSFSTQYAMRKIVPTDIAAALGQGQVDALLQRAYVAAGESGTFGQAKDKLMAALGQMVMGQPVDIDMRTRAALEKEIAALPGGQAELFSQMIAAKKGGMSVRDMTYIQEYQQGLGGRLALQRLAGLGENRTGVDVAATLGLGTRFSSEELAGMRAQMGQVAGRGMMGFKTGGLLSRQFGGLSNIANIVAAGAQYGGAEQLYNLFGGGGGALGRGGVDVTAGARIGDVVTQALMQGGMGFPQGGAGLAGGLLSMVGPGTPGEQMRGARIAGEGLQAYGGIAGGGIDNLQKGINVLAANQALGQYSLGARHAVMRMTPAQMMNALRTGEVPQELKDYGVGIEDLRAYMGARSQFDFARFHAGTGMGGQVEVAGRGAQQAGGAINYIRSLGNLGQEQIREQARYLGTALASTTGGQMTPEQGYGVILSQLAEANMLAPARGGGAHDPAGKQAIAAKRKNDQAALDYEKRVAELGGEITKTGREPTAAGLLDVAGRDITTASKVAAGALADFSSAMRPVINILREVGTPGSPTKTGAPK